MDLLSVPALGDERLPKYFWDKCGVDTLTGCWVWTACTVKGYGKFSVKRSHLRAHRHAYIVLIGRIPDGLNCDHLCRNRGCVNPAHIDIVTNRENVLRGIGPSAINARKTICKYGHAFTDENTFRTGRGRRVCKKCREADWAKYKAKNMKKLRDDARERRRKKKEMAG